MPTSVSRTTGSGQSSHAFQHGNAKHNFFEIRLTDSKLHRKGNVGLFSMLHLVLTFFRFRFAQCLRRYRDTKDAFPHLANAGKYSTTFFVVLFSTMNTAYSLLGYNSNGSYNPFFYLWISSSVLR